MNILPPVTVAIPVFNAAPFISDSIRSVLAQTHGDFELLIIDDGSIDRSLEIVRSIVDPRIRVIADGQNRGLAERLNQVVELARYDLIARMDADDAMMPDRLERQVRLLRDRPDYDIVAARIFSIDREGRVLGSRGNGDQAITDLVARGVSPFVHPTVMYRTAWLRRNPYGSALRRAEDLDLWLRAAARGDLRATIINEPLLCYREDQGVDPAKLLRAYREQWLVVPPMLSTGKHRRLFFLRTLLKIALVKLIPFRFLSKFLIGRRRGLPLTENDLARLRAVEAITIAKLNAPHQART